MSTTLDVGNLMAEAGWLQRFATTLVTDRDVAEDVTQETLLAALRSPPDSAKLRPWLRSVAGRFALQLRRGSQRRARRERAAARADEVPGTAEVLERVDLQRLAVTALLELAEPYRSSLLMRYFEDASYREIAERMGVPEETVRTRLRRGLSKLRATLDVEHGSRAAWAGPLIGLSSRELARPRVPWLLPLVAAGALAAVGWFTWQDPAGPAPVEVTLVRWPFT